MYQSFVYQLQGKAEVDLLHCMCVYTVDLVHFYISTIFILVSVLCITIYVQYLISVLPYMSSIYSLYYHICLVYVLYITIFVWYMSSVLPYLSSIWPSFLHYSEINVLRPLQLETTCHISPFQQEYIPTFLYICTLIKDHVSFKTTCSGPTWWSFLSLY